MATPVCRSDASLLPQQQQDSKASILTEPRQDASFFVSPLPTGKEDEVLRAVSSPSLTNVIMAGFIRDNGLVSHLNRGRFYTCRSKQNHLEGVALVGHTILIEAFAEGAIEAFASVARRESSPHLLMGEHTLVQQFWKYYADKQQTPRLVCPVLFLRRDKPFEEQPPIPVLRPARRDDLEHVVQAQAAMAHETSGVDPLKKDPQGFRERYLRRIEKDRVWVLMKDGQLVFKADLIAETPQATYIEGVYVTPDERSKGLGRSCLVSLGRNILERSKAIYLFVENENSRTKSFYLNLGFSVAGQYDLLYF
jgi:uncharacterized protein